jgi:hypothetical protein
MFAYDNIVVPARSILLSLCREFNLLANQIFSRHSHLIALCVFNRHPRGRIEASLCASRLANFRESLLVSEHPMEISAHSLSG